VNILKVYLYLYCGVYKWVVRVEERLKKAWILFSGNRETAFPTSSSHQYDILWEYHAYYATAWLQNHLWFLYFHKCSTLREIMEEVNMSALISNVGFALTSCHWLLILYISYMVYFWKFTVIQRTYCEMAPI
jgi:hypothetical protein